MYFRCPLIQVTMLVERCEATSGVPGKARRQMSCKKCSDWETHTSKTIPRHIVEAPATQALKDNPLPTKKQLEDRAKVDRLFRYK